MSGSGAEAVPARSSESSQWMKYSIPRQRGSNMHFASR